MKKIVVGIVLVLAFSTFVLSRTKPNTPASALQDCSTFTTFTESLPNFFVGVPANFTITAVGGTPPYQFHITSGALPNGLHMNQHGKITGKPKAVDDTTIFVEFSDSQGCSFTQAYAVRVDP